MKRDAAASMKNPLYKSSLFSSHFKLHGISVAPDSHQSYLLSTRSLVLTAIKHPQMSKKPMEFSGRDFRKIQGKSIAMERFCRQMSEGGTQVSHNLTKSSKRHLGPFMLPLPASSTPSLLAHICITIQKENH